MPNGHKVHYYFSCTWMIFVFPSLLTARFFGDLQAGHLMGDKYSLGKFNP
jgi:hypothetical protein